MVSFYNIWKIERKIGYYMIISKIIILAVFFLGIIIYMAYDKYVSWKHRNFIKINAKIKKINNISPLSFFTVKYYKCQAVINYNVDGKKYKTSTTFNLPFKPKVGDDGKIYYNPSDPNNIIVPHQISEMLRKVIPISLLIGSIPATLIIIFMYIFRNNKYFQTLVGLGIIGWLRLLIKIIRLS